MLYKKEQMKNTDQNLYRDLNDDEQWIWITVVTIIIDDGNSACKGKSAIWHEYRLHW